MGRIARRLGVRVAGLTFGVALLAVLGTQMLASAPALAAGLETPEISVVSPVPATAAGVQGVLNPHATKPVEAGSYEFLYKQGKTGCTGGSAAPVPPGLMTGVEAEPVVETLSNLTTNTEYSVCLRVENTTTHEEALSSVVTFTTALPPEKPETLSLAKSITATTAVLEGVLNPHVNAKDGWFFYYSPYEGGCPYFETALEPEVTGTALKEQAEATGLEPHTKYTFCLVAVNAAHESALSSNEASFETPSAPPTVVGEGASSVTASTARIEGTVNPSNEVTECHFEYGVASVTEHEVPCEQPVLEGIEPVGVGLNLAGLTQHTTYHYRILAKNGTGTKEGKEEALTTGTPEVPETKAATEIGPFAAKLHGVLNPNHAGEAGTYEFVYRESATECQGKGERATSGVAANGLSPEPVSEEVTSLFPGATYTVCLRATNGAGEQALGDPVSFTTPAIAPTVAEEFVDEVSSGSATLHGQVNPGGAETTYRFEYGPTASYGETLSGRLNAGPETVNVEVHLQDLAPGVLYHYRLVASNEIDTEVTGPDHTFTTQLAAAPFALPDGRAWEMVSPPNKNGSEIATNHLVGGGDFQASEDGDAVTYITSQPISEAARGNPIEPQVFSRRGSNGWESEDIATPHDRGSSEEYQGDVKPRISVLAEYMAFSPDLSLAYVEPEAQTPLAPGQPAPEENPPNTLHYSSGYVRNMTTGTYSITKLNPEEWYAEQLARVQGPPSCDAGTSPAKGEGVDAVSRDGCYVYFNSKSLLSPGASGENPLYVSHYEDGAWKTTFISSLSGTGVPEWSGDYVELSPNGRYVAFMSELSLTGYDNRDAVTGEADEEVYLYDAVENRLACASCNPTGARPAGQFDDGQNNTFITAKALLVDPTTKWSGHRLAGTLPDWSLEARSCCGVRIHQPRYVTDSGMLFFDSPDKLVAQDVNGLENVYEYEPEGLGGCTRSAGCISSISSGTSDKESAFVDASASGGDAFFITSSRLTVQDVDEAADMYDAHICSVATPCLQPLVAPAPCETSDSCKAPPTPQSPIFGEPATWTFSGAGNIAGSPRSSGPAAKPRSNLKRCRKGYRRDKHGVCVRQKKAKAKAKKSSRGSK